MDVDFFGDLVSLLSNGPYRSYCDLLWRLIGDTTWTKTRGLARGLWIGDSLGLQTGFTWNLIVLVWWYLESNRGYVGGPKALGC